MKAGLGPITGIENAWRSLAGERSAICMGPAGGGEGEDGEGLDGELEKSLASLSRVFSGSPRAVERLRVREFREEARSRQWVASRRCLVTVLEKLLSAGEAPERIHASLSHCVDRTVAAACASPGVVGVGVDVERADRKLSAAATARVLETSEAQDGLSALEAWVLKEAAYKSDPESAGRVIAHYRLKRLESAYSAEVERSRFRFSLLTFRDQDHWIAMSVAFVRSDDASH